MAVEEQEYFSFHAGNGVSAVREPEETKKPKKQRQQRQGQASSGGSFKPFFQGITLGTVLLIPAGVWYWVKMAPEEPVAAVEEQAPARPAKGAKGAASYNAKRKLPAKSVVAVPAAVVPARIDDGTAGASGVAASEPAPVPAPVAAVEPAPSITTPPSLVAPRSGEAIDMGTPEKPKKNIFRKLAAPFHKGGNGGDPPAPDGQ